MTETENNSPLIDPNIVANAPITAPAATAKPATPDAGGFVWGTGRRKSSVARVRVKPGKGTLLINKRKIHPSPQPRSTIFGLFSFDMDTIDSISFAVKEWISPRCLILPCCQKSLFLSQVARFLCLKPFLSVTKYILLFPFVVICL